MRSMGELPEDRWRSDAFCSNIKLKKASIFAITVLLRSAGLLAKSAPHADTVNRLVEIIRSEMKKAGAISFARFMELALYCPVYGYYEKEADTIGRGGDYITSVSVGALLGELLAFQFAEWLVGMSNPGSRRHQTPSACSLPTRRCIVEAGAHDGRLAMDILSWLRGHRRDLFDDLRYYIVEPSSRRRERQRAMLSSFEARVRWVTGLRELAAVFRNKGLRGIMFSNELLDAMPVHRLGWDATNGSWFEWGVALKDHAFVWTKIPPPPTIFENSAAGGLAELPEGLRQILPEGFTTDYSPAAARWWAGAAEILRQGKLLTMDYGLAAEEFFAPERSRGTVRAYHHHHLSGELLANPGKQDLTAHVNFTSIKEAGEKAGLTTETLADQGPFLTKIAERIWSAPSQFGEWTPARSRQFQTLTHPEHLGRTFRVLIQARGA